LQVPNKADSEHIVTLEVRHVGNYEQFPHSNKSLQYYNEKEGRVEATAAKRQETTEDQKTRRSVNERIARS
jgi:hypothetical protein